MNAITEARDQLRTALEGIENLNVHDAYPDVVQPPALIVFPDEPYMSLGPTFAGSYDVHMQLILAVSRTAKLAGVDDLLADVLQAKHGWRLTAVASIPAEANERPDLLSTVVKLSKTVYL